MEDDNATDIIKWIFSSSLQSDLHCVTSMEIDGKVCKAEVSSCYNVKVIMILCSEVIYFPLVYISLLMSTRKLLHCFIVYRSVIKVCGS